MNKKPVLNKLFQKVDKGTLPNSFYEEASFRYQNLINTVPENKITDQYLSLS